jgi:hypothetical protein
MTTAPERAAEYHDDNEGRLSSSIARPMILKTCAHAKAILDGRVTFDSDAMTLGTAVHQLLLRDDRVDILEFDSYRKAEAQEKRDWSRSIGRVPILRPRFDEAREIAQHVNGQMLELGITPTPFTKGSAEVVIRWDDPSGARCRALLDWLHDDLSVIDDLKTTSDASPRKFARHIFNMGYDVQAAFYVRAVRLGTKMPDDFPFPRFRWVVVETKPPYPISVHTLTERAMASAQVKVDTAIQLWNECMASGVWPAYPNSVQEVDIPGWASDEADTWAEVDVDEVPF